MCPSCYTQYDSTHAESPCTTRPPRSQGDGAMKVLVIGGGIGGFATALSLHAVGIECQVFEQSRTIREFGVGMNMLPHAVKELAELGLLDALDRVAIRTSELIY